MNYLSATLSGPWLIDEQHMPAVYALIRRMDNSVARPPANTQPVKPVQSCTLNNAYEVGYYSDLAQVPKGANALVNIVGPIFKYGAPAYGIYGSSDFAEIFTAISKADNISGILINIDSPGGQASGTAALVDAIREAGKKKPVIGIINDGIAASAGAWIASACTEVYCTQVTDEIGSHGAYTTIANWVKFYESIGLEVKEIYAPQSTDKNKTYHDALKGDESGIKADLKVLVDQFLKSVNTNRAGKLTSQEWTTGKMYHAKDAQKIGLIDGIKSPAQIVQRLQTLSSTKKQTNMSTKTFSTVAATAKAETIAANADGQYSLTDAQMDNLEISINAANTANADLQTKLNAATAQNTKLSAEIDTLKESLTKATTERDDWKAKAEEFGSKTDDLDNTSRAADPGAETKKHRKNSMDAYAESMGVSRY